MKNKILFTICLICSISLKINAGTIKGGVFYNTEIVKHKTGQINYPGIELSYEKMVRTKFSISASFCMTKREYSTGSINDFSNLNFYGNNKWTNYDKSLILEGRYYFKSNHNGLFIHVGVPLTYTIEKTFSKTINGEEVFTNYDYSINTIAGLGIKYPLTSLFGIEMKMGYSPSLNFLGVDYGTSGFIKSEVKFCLAFGNKGN